MKKITKFLSVVIATLSLATSISLIHAGNGMSTTKASDMQRSSSSSKLSSPQLTHANTQNACFLYPTDETILKKHMKKKHLSAPLPPPVLKKVAELVETGSQIIDTEKITGRTGTYKFTFIRDKYSEGDATAINEFANKLLDTRTVSRTAAPSTDITCRYPSFIINAYTTIHSTQLLTCAQQLQAVQMIFAGLKSQNKYMLDKSHTDRLLGLDPDQITRFALTLIRTPIDPILQPGDFAILIEFPDITILYTIR